MTPTTTPNNRYFTDGWLDNQSDNFDGEATFKCPACHGSGRFRTYSGRDGGPCFKCKGKGNISKGQNAAIKGKATRAANVQAWQETHAKAITYINKRAAKGSTFYAPSTRWPDFRPGMPPRPSVQVIVKRDGGVVGS